MTKEKTLMTEGPIVPILLKFAFPLFLGNLFQQLYNTVDSLVVGNVCGDAALAAVSSSGSLCHLFIGFFQGVFMGASVIISQRDMNQPGQDPTVTTGKVILQMVYTEYSLTWAKINYRTEYTLTDYRLNRPNAN